MTLLRGAWPTVVLMCFLPRIGVCDMSHYNTASGLGSDYVTAMLEDQAGNLWFGTYFGGVSRYDGLHWQSFTTTDGLGGNEVQAVYQDRAGNLWLGIYHTERYNSGGLSKYDGHQWETFIIDDGFLGSLSVSAIHEDHARNLWIGVGSAVFRYDGVAWQPFTMSDGLAGSVREIFEDRNGNLWFATSNGVTRYDGTTWIVFRTENGLAHNSVSSIAEDRDGNLWFGTGGGASRYDGVGWTTLSILNGLPSNAVRAVLEDRAGRMWFATDQGIARYDGASMVTITTADGLSSNSVYDIMEDRVGNLFVSFGLDGNGLDRYDGVNWRVFTTADGLAGSSVAAALADSLGNVWFGTNHGVSRYDGYNWTTFTTADGLPSNNVTAILEDGPSTLWVGTDRGLSRYDGVGWRTYDVTNSGLADNFVREVIKDRLGALWIATDQGVTRNNGAFWQTFTRRDGLAWDRVSAMLEDHDGNIWFGTIFGATRFDGSNWVTFTTRDGLPADFVSALLEDHSGNLWFGTSAGVSRYDGSSWKTFTTADGLASDYIPSLGEDRHGNIWFGTDRGLFRFDGENLGACSTELAFNIRSEVVEDRSGSIWFGTPGGAVRYQSDRVPPRTAAITAPPAVSSSRVASGVFVAAYGEQGVLNSVRANSGSWSPWAVHGSWLLTDLPDGVHIVEGRTRDRIGNVDPQPRAVTFEVDATPPSPIIASPAFGQALRGRCEIRGVANDGRFQGYRLDARPEGVTEWSGNGVIALDSSQVAVATNGVLGHWNTELVGDGLYELRIALSDTLGLVGVGQVTVLVDNHAPFAEVTAPREVSATEGGDVYSTLGEVHLYFPPRAFADDAQVAVTRGGLLDMAGRDPPGPVDTWVVAWDKPLLKSITLEMASAGLAATPPPAIFRERSSNDWERIGGTFDPSRGLVSAAITQPGRYALRPDASPPSGGSSELSALGIVPRVLSHSAASPRRVGISFTLARSAPTSISIYNRAGRRVRELAQGTILSAGANLVYWDGLDQNGRPVEDGVYLVGVEALGEVLQKQVGVVR